MSLNQSKDEQNICLCGVEKHKKHHHYCPFPYYGNDQKCIDKWNKLWTRNKNEYEKYDNFVPKNHNGKIRRR